MGDNTARAPDDVRPCTTGCGFFGSSQTGYMCSKCFKDTAGQTRASIEAPAPTPSSPLSVATTPAMMTAASSSSVAAIASSSDIVTAGSKEATAIAVAAVAVAEGGALKAGGEESSTLVVPSSAAAPTPQKKKNRCAVCNKKVGLTGIECRCEMTFCGMHRYPDQHACTFDFKAHDRENLAKVVMGGGEFSKIDHL